MRTPSLLGIALFCLSAMPAAMHDVNPNFPKRCGGQRKNWYQTGRYCIRYFNTPLSFADAEFKFSWIDGSFWNYENWVLDQPDNSGNTENCVEMNWKILGEWNDDLCTKRKPFVCAFKRLGLED